MEAKLRATHKSNFLLCAEAHLVYKIEIVGSPHPDYDEIRDLHFAKVFNEMLSVNHFPEHIKLHRRRFAFALLRARDIWSDDSIRAHAVVRIFELFNKFSPIPHHKYPNERKFQERLEIVFEHMQRILPGISEECSHETDSAEGE